MQTGSGLGLDGKHNNQWSKVMGIINNCAMFSWIISSLFSTSQTQHHHNNNKLFTFENQTVALGLLGRPATGGRSARPEYFKWNTMFFSIKMKKSIKKNNSIFVIKYTVRRITKLQTSACGMCNSKYYRVNLQLNILDQDSSFMVNNE